MDRRQAVVRNHVLQHVEGIVADDSQIRQFFALDCVQQASHAGPVYLHRDEIRLGVRLGDRDRGFAHPGADLQDQLAG